MKVLYQRPRFRVIRRAICGYDLQVKVLHVPPAPEQWVTIELYDYFHNARVRAKGMHEICDGRGGHQL